LKEAHAVFDKTLKEHTDCFKKLDGLRDPINEAANTILSALMAGKKILICGNGGSASDAQHFAAEIVGRYTREREAWPAIALTTDTSILTAVANDYGYDTIFSRQVEGLGQTGEVLIGISTSGNSPNVLKAIEQAQKIGMATIALTGNNGGIVSGAADTAVIVPSKITARIQEAHIFILHLWADIAESALAANEEP
jgi:D-sedoheptulose 7-phosphate isomerase